MKFNVEKGTGRAINEDDPKIWVQMFFPDPRTDEPYRFILSIHERKIGFAVAKSLSASIELSKKLKEEPAIILREVGLSVSGNANALEPGRLKSNSSGFKSRPQQELAIEAILDGIKAILRSCPPKLQVDVKFPPDVWAKFERGEYIQR